MSTGSFACTRTSYTLLLFLLLRLWRGKLDTWFVNLVADKAARTIIDSQPSPTDIVRARGLEHGLLIYSRRTAGGKYGDWIMATPPLTISEAECDELVSRLERTLEAACSDLRAQGALAGS